LFYVVNRDRDNFRKYQMDSENVEEELRKLEELAKDSAVGETMYDKKSVIEKILEVGKHFQQTSYIKDGELRELEKDIEEKLCTLWDISVEEDVSEFYLEHGVLDIFIELFSNPNNRVKEIAAGIMSNMVSHPTVFLKLMEVDKYLESCSKLLEEKDSPTLVVTLRILHSYSFNLFQLLNSDERQRRSKEDIKNVLNRFLVFLSLERMARNIGIIVASCTNKEVLLNASKFLSIFSELWEHCEERSKVAQYFAEEQFIVCVLEAITESLGEDKTEKHLAVFLNIIYENDVDKDTSAALSDKVLVITNRLLKEHVLKYNTVEESDLEFIFNLLYLVKVSLNSGGYESIPYKLSSTMTSVRSRLDASGLDKDNVNMASVFQILGSLEVFLETIKTDHPGNGHSQEEDDSCSTTSESSLANTPRTFGTPQTFDTPQSSFNTPRH